MNTEKIKVSEWPFSITGRLRKVVLIRHGESMANAGATTCDPASITLTPRGQEQARLAAERIDFPVAIITSPFARALATAAPLREKYPDASYDVWPIQEFTYLSPARCTGTTTEQRRAWVDEYWARSDPHWVDGPGAESFAEFLERAAYFISRLKGLPSHSRVAIYGHGQFFSAARWMTCIGLDCVDQVLTAHPNAMAEFREFDRNHHLGNGGTWIFYLGLDGSWLHD